MPKPTYEQLERRVKELEKIAGDLIGKAMDYEQDDGFELSILYNISEALTTTRELDELLAIVCDEVRKALLAEGAGVLLYDETRGDLYWRQVRDARQILAAQSNDLRLPIEGSIAGWVFKNNQPARVNDTSRDPRYYPEMTKKSGFDIRKVLQVPLKTSNKTIGVLMVMNKIGGNFTRQDEALASSMAGTIALAIDNATVYKTLKKSKDDLEMIYRASMALATTMDLDHLLAVIIEELRTALNTQAAGLLLYDEHKGDLYWREVQDENGTISAQSADLRLPLDRSISGQVFQTGEPALLNDPAHNPNFFRPFEERSGFHIRNEIIVPLHTREKTIGVLVVINKREGNFTEEDVHILSSLAGVVALAVENATFFEELLSSYRDLENLNRVKSKILNHLSHELRTPLAIIRGTLATMWKRLRDMGLKDFDRSIERMNRHVQSLNRLEAQVESIMMTGYTWERRWITDFLQKALDLMEVQTEWTPQIRQATSVIHQWLEKTFPTRRDELERINVREFGVSVFEFVRTKAEEQKRFLNLDFNLEDGELLIPGHVLRAIMEGLIRNAVEATPDHGTVYVTGHTRGERYIFTVKDTGIGIPDKDKELIFEGFYPVQDTENYSSGRPYSFNAGGKGIDLLRIRMFSELYGFKLSFTSQRCPHLKNQDEGLPGNVELCVHCSTMEDCANNGGSEFTVDFPLADSKAMLRLKEEEAA
ncbi:MAG: GAF domain-containing protein [Desulfomonile tiedjei]|uniref:histidine kinase n=1 Tax=Desulfomonile tiedjei TaxID=2358 RepID=A0A9D6V8K2_9BACT|nr:GAF domain-containing protein [Desulfomonile tiedjei]